MNVLPCHTSADLFLLPAKLNIEEGQTLRRYLLFPQNPCFEAYNNKNVGKGEFFCFTFGIKPTIIIFCLKYQRLPRMCRHFNLTGRLRLIFRVLCSNFFNLWGEAEISQPMLKRTCEWLGKQLRAVSAHKNEILEFKGEGKLKKEERIW